MDDVQSVGDGPFYEWTGDPNNGAVESALGPLDILGGVALLGTLMVRGAVVLGMRLGLQVGKVTKGGVDDLLKAGQQADKNGLTKAGRGLQKHGDREGSVFPKSIGNAAARNQQGQDVLDSLLKSRNKTSKPNRFGGKDFFDNNAGRGARFDGDGNMRGFLEP